MSTKQNGITHMVAAEKDPGTPVWPTYKSWADILLGFTEFALRNRDDRKLTKVLGYGLEAKAHEKIMSMFTKVAACGMDPAKASALYDSIHGTSTMVTENPKVPGEFTMVSVPGPDHKGVGFYPIDLWEELEWKDGEVWRKGFLSAPMARADGTLEVSDEEDPMSPTHLVDRRMIRRKGQ